MSVTHNVSGKNIPTRFFFTESSERKRDERLKSASASERSESSRESKGTEEEEEEESVAVRDKRLTAPRSRVRTLQDLLKDRAVITVDSSDKFRIEWLPADRFVSDSAREEIHFHERSLEERSSREEKKQNRFFRFFERICTCGRKEIEKEDVVRENLKGESVSVETVTQQRNAASATLDDATMQVLEAAKRKRIIAQYSK